MSLNRVLVCCCMLFATIPAFSMDELDSLKAARRMQLEEGDQDNLMQTYYRLGRAYLGVGQADSAYTEFTYSLEYAESLGDTYLQFLSLLQMGQIDGYPRNNPSAAVRRLLKAEEIAGEDVPIADLKRLYFELGSAYLLANDFENSLKYQLQSVDLAETIQDTAFLAASLRSLGSLYWQIDQFSNALNTYRQALELRSSLPGPHFSIYSLMAIAHFSLEQTDSALHYIRRARVEAAAYSQIYGEAYSLGLIGNIKMDQGRYKQAVDSLEASVSLCEEHGFFRDATSFRMDLGRAYGLNRQFDLALRELKLAEREAKQMNQTSLLTSNYEIQSDVYAWQGDSAKSLVYLKQYYQLKDSLVNEEVIAGMADIARGFEIGKRDDMILEQQQELDASRRLLYISLFASGIVFLLILLYMTYLRNKALREVNQLLENKNGEIRRQNHRLASSNEDLRQFAHVTSHDLREPLRNISSFATLISRRYRGKLDENADEYLGFITNSVKKMDRLLNDLLTYSVVGVFEHEYSQVDIGKTISDIMRRLQQNKETQGAKISLHQLPIIRANAQQMDQLFTQLIDNAIKFRADGRRPEINIRAEAREKGFVFSVSDNGIGMDKVYKDKIFALFLRLHNQQSAYEGSGIGLSIVKKIVEQHEGRIWIESEVGEGTSVFFFLPKDPPSDQIPLHIKDRWQWLNTDEVDIEEVEEEEPVVEQSPDLQK